VLFITAVHGTPMHIPIVRTRHQESGW